MIWIIFSYIVIYSLNMTQLIFSFYIKPKGKIMNIGILGTGIVGTTIGSKLIHIGNSVKMGAREAENPKAVEWTKSNGKNASQGTLKDAASFG